MRLIKNLLCTFTKEVHLVLNSLLFHLLRSKKILPLVGYFCMFYLRLPVSKLAIKIVDQE